MKILKILLKPIGWILKSLFMSILIAIFLGIFLVTSVVSLTGVFSKDEKYVVEKGTYLEMNFKSGLNEKVSSSPFSFSEGENFYGVLEGIKKAKDDVNVEGILIDLDSVNISLNQIDEIGKELIEFRKTGKKVFSFGNVLDNSSYALGIYGDKIVTSPSEATQISIGGYFREFPYYKELANKYGIKFNVIHVGNYKSMGENFAKSSMSSENRENLTRIYDNIFQKRVNDIATYRKIDKNIVSQTLENGDLMYASPKEVHSLKFLDAVEYKESFLEKNKVKKILSFDEYIMKNEMPMGLSSVIAKGRELKKETSKDKIVLLYAEGEIGYEMNGKEGIFPESMKAQIKDIREDKSVKGVVLRVNSPGGSALASELIYQELKTLKVPVYVSMGSVAASGGYYISAIGEKIFAEEGTITGSIGVVSVIPNFSDSAKKYNVNIETIEKGKYSGLYSLLDPLDEGEQKRIYDSSLKVYEEFKGRVLTHRKKLTPESLEAIAGGRVWLGQEAIKNGLVDEIGGLRAAVVGLAKDKGINDFEVVESEELMDLAGYKKLLNFIESPKINIDVEIMEKIEEISNKPLMLMLDDYSELM